MVYSLDRSLIANTRQEKLDLRAEGCCASPSMTGYTGQVRAPITRVQNMTYIGISESPGSQWARAMD